MSLNVRGSAGVKFDEGIERGADGEVTSASQLFPTEFGRHEIKSLTVEEPHTENWNFKAIFGQTIAMGAGRQLGSPHVVLPFLFIAAGGPILAAALIVPVVEISRLVGFAGTAPAIRAARGVKWHLVLILVATAVSFAAIGVAARFAPPDVLAVLFLAAAVVVGIGMAASTLVHQDLLGRLVSERRRNHLMYGQAIFAGVLAIAIAALSHFQLADYPPLHRHLALLWGGRLRLRGFGHTRGDHPRAATSLAHTSEAPRARSRIPFRPKNGRDQSR